MDVKDSFGAASSDPGVNITGTVYSKPVNLKDCFSIAYSKQRANPIKTLAASQKLALLETVIPRASREAEFQPSADSWRLRSQHNLHYLETLSCRLSNYSLLRARALTQPSPSSAGSFRELI